MYNERATYPSYYPPPSTGGSQGSIYPPPSTGGSQGSIYPPPSTGGSHSPIGGTIPGTSVSFGSLLQKYPKPTSPPPPQAQAIVKQLKANPSLIQQLIQHKPKNLQQVYQIMGVGGREESSTFSYNQNERGLCPPGVWEIILYFDAFGTPQVDLVFNILPFFIPGIVVGFVDPFFNLQLFRNVVWEICCTAFGC